MCRKVRVRAANGRGKGEKESRHKNIQWRNDKRGKSVPQKEGTRINDVSGEKNQVRKAANEEAYRCAERVFTGKVLR